VEVLVIQMAFDPFFKSKLTALAGLDPGMGCIVVPCSFTQDFAMYPSKKIHTDVIPPGFLLGSFHTYVYCQLTPNLELVFESLINLEVNGTLI